MKVITKNGIVGQEQAINLPAVFFLVGVVVCGFAAAMLVPAAIGIDDSMSRLMSATAVV